MAFLLVTIHLTSSKSECANAYETHTFKNNMVNKSNITVMQLVLLSLYVLSSLNNQPIISFKPFGCVDPAIQHLWSLHCSIFCSQDNYLSEYFALEATYPTAVDIWCLNLYRGALAFISYLHKDPENEHEWTISDITWQLTIPSCGYFFQTQPQGVQ